MYKIEYRSAILRDLEETTTYLCNELSAFSAANKLLDKLDIVCKNLSEHPYMYKAYDSVLILPEPYRIVALDNYILFYTINENSQTVSLCLLFYGGRDFDNLLP